MGQELRAKSYNPVDGPCNEDCERIKKLYCDMIGPFLESAYHTVLFIDELTLSAEMFNHTIKAEDECGTEESKGLVTVMVGITWDGLLCYDIKHGCYTLEDVGSFLSRCVEKLDDENEKAKYAFSARLCKRILVTDMKPIHFNLPPSLPSDFKIDALVR
jgi:hypothetical protein